MHKLPHLRPGLVSFSGEMSMAPAKNVCYDCLIKFSLPEQMQVYPSAVSWHVAPGAQSLLPQFG
jgi:hypothetical protein